MCVNIPGLADDSDVLTYHHHHKTKNMTSIISRPPPPSFFSDRSIHSPSMAISSLLSVVSASHLPFSSPNHHLRRRSHPPISISTNPSHIDASRLRDLLSSAGHCCHRFPAHSGEALADPVDLEKLRTAIHHSFILVSVFCRSRFLPSAAAAASFDEASDATSVHLGFQRFFERSFWSPGPDHHLIGFGRAVSDGGLTASIHDVAVMPSLQKRGIGRKIVERIIRILTNKGIYDISALCSEKERFFFEACGFGKDPLDSTTMMYTKTPSSDQKGNFMVRTAGRMLLVVPRPLELYPSEREQCGG